MKYKKYDYKFKLDLKPDELQSMADQDPNKFAAHMESITAKIAQSFGVPNHILLSPQSIYGKSPMTYATGGATVSLNGKSVLERCRTILRDFPCSHCDDRDIWRHSHNVTLVGRVCSKCLSECLSRGITLRMIVGDKLVVASKIRSTLDGKDGSE